MISICLSVDVMEEALVLFRFVSFRCTDESDGEWVMVALVALLSGWTPEAFFFYSPDL